MTDATSAPAAPSKKQNFDIGKALSKTFSTTFNRFFYFTGVSMIGLVVVYGAMFGLIFALAGVEAFDTLDGTSTSGELSAAEALFIVPAVLIVMLGFALLHNVTIRSAVSVQLEGKVQFGQAIKSGLIGIFPLVLIGIILIIPYYIGILLLIIPGMYLMAMFYAVAPVIVYEGKGLGAMGRALELTKDYRWAIMGYYFILGVLVFLIQTGIFLVIGLISIAAGFGGVAGGEPNIALFVISQIITALLGFGALAIILVLSFIGPAIAYARLVEIKEGSSDRFLEVFE